MCRKLHCRTCPERLGPGSSSCPCLSGLAHGDLDEAILEGEVVGDAVLPGWELAAVVAEAAADEGPDAIQSEALVQAK